MIDHTTAEVTRLDPCDFGPDAHPPAAVDGKTVFGSWAYMCEDCFSHYGMGLGESKGQRLVLRESVAQ